MGYSDLPTDLQNIIFTNFEFFAKIIIIVGIGLLSFYYINKFHNQLKTPYLMVGIIKTMTLCLSYLYLALSPLYILLLYPQFPLQNMIVWLFVGLSVVYTLLFIFFLVNIAYYPPLYFLKMAGIDSSLTRDNKVLKRIDKFLGLEKLKRDLSR